jgi:hypothetical protein
MCSATLYVRFVPIADIGEMWKLRVDICRMQSHVRLASAPGTPLNRGGPVNRAGRRMTAPNLVNPARERQERVNQIAPSSTPLPCGLVRRRRDPLSSSPSIQLSPWRFYR